MGSVATFGNEKFTNIQTNINISQPSDILSPAYQLHFQLSEISSITSPPTLPTQPCSIVPTLAEASSKPPLQTILAVTKNLLSTSHPGEPRGFPLTLPPASIRM
jgi:hypothetical protein